MSEERMSSYDIASSRYTTAVFKYIEGGGNLDELIELSRKLEEARIRQSVLDQAKAMRSKAVVYIQEIHRLEKLPANHFPGRLQEVKDEMHRLDAEASKLENTKIKLN